MKSQSRKDDIFAFSAPKLTFCGATKYEICLRMKLFFGNFCLIHSKMSSFIKNSKVTRTNFKTFLKKLSLFRNIFHVRDAQRSVKNLLPLLKLQNFLSLNTFKLKQKEKQLKFVKWKMRIWNLFSLSMKMTVQMHLLRYLGEFSESGDCGDYSNYWN